MYIRNDKKQIAPCGLEIVDVRTALDALMCGASTNDFIVDDAVEIMLSEQWEDKFLEPSEIISVEDNIDTQAFHIKRQDTWFFPAFYQNMDIEEYILSKCTTDIERDRASNELSLYKERELYLMLKFMVFLVDHMRLHKIVWGVGRGSSVCSFCLYLIGINRVNPLIYDLQIEDFLK